MRTGVATLAILVAASLLATSAPLAFGHAPSIKPSVSGQTVVGPRREPLLTDPSDVELNLLNGSTYVSPSLVYGSWDGSTTNTSFPILLTGGNTSEFWAEGSPVMLMAPSGDPHASGILLYGAPSGNNTTILSIGTGVPNPLYGNGLESYLFLRPLGTTSWEFPYWATGGDHPELNNSECGQGSVVFPYSSSPYVVVQWNDWDITGGGCPTSALNLYLVTPDPNGTVNASNIDFFAGVGTTSGSAPSSGDYLPFNVTYSFQTNELSAVLSDENSSNTSYSFNVNLSSYDFTPGSGDPGAYYFGAGGSAGGIGPSGWSLLYSSITSSLVAEYPVELIESGLPPGTSWSVTLNGVTESSTTSMITFTEPNGTYAFSVGSVNGYAASPVSGSVMVNGASVSQPIIYSMIPASTYTVTFIETGLPAETIWTVTLNGVTMTGAGSSIAFTGITNGTYAFSVGFVDDYTVSPVSGSVTVNGAGVSQPVTYSMIPASTYTVSFTETGLPPTATWYVNISGGQSHSSTESTLNFAETNGTYDYTFGSTYKNYSAPGGSFTVDGAPISEMGTFNKVISPPPVTIAKNGASWNISAAPANLSSNSFQSLSAISLTSSPSWTLSGTFTASFGITAIIFTPTQYTSWEGSAYEQALPAGSYVWETSGNEFSGSVNATLASGTYFLVWDNLNLIYSTSVRVTSAIVAAATATQPYLVTFMEVGLASGTAWSVTLGGYTQSSTNGTVAFLAVNGTYGYAFSSASGYASRPSTGTVTVNGSSPNTVTASFTSPSSSGPDLLSWLYVAIGVLIVVVIGVAVGLMRQRRALARTSPSMPSSGSSAIGRVGGSGKSAPPVPVPLPVPVVSTAPQQPREDPPTSAAKLRGSSTGVLPAPTALNLQYCPYCGHANRTEFAFCQKCGKKIPPMH